ncbi:hypothetical protein ACLB2K_064491 [Fragaria x ananassa]
MEEDVSDMEAHVDDLGQRVEGLEAEDVAIHTAIKGMVVQLEESLQGEMAKIREEFIRELTKMRQVHEKELSSTLARIGDMHGDLTLCKRALAMGADTSGITEEDAKIRTTALYLTETAILWWRRRRGDVEKGTCTITNFDDFTKELKRQFYPENAEDEARACLRRLKHSESVRDYIKDFTNLVLEIPDFLNKDALFNFMDGLQPWTKTELRVCS